MNPDTGPDQLTLERYRKYLMILARLNWDDRLAGKVDASDIVQQTLLEAWHGRDQVRGSTEPQLCGWLRKILTRNLIDAVRKWTGRVHDVRREHAIQESIEQSSTCLERYLAADQSSPSDRAERNERLLQLSEALEKLPADQRTAVELRHLKGWSLKEISDHMGKTEAALGGLLRRGRQSLAELLSDERSGTIDEDANE